MKVSYVPMKGIEFLLKVEALCNPRAQRFDPAAVADSTVMQGLKKAASSTRFGTTRVAITFLRLA
jgi:hypothetical protein